MSTRRARIKAVAALPPRRKNVASVDGTNKAKDNYENSIKSPKTPKSLAGISDEGGSLTVRSPPALIPLTSITTLVPENDTTRVSTPTENSTLTSEKVSVITSVSDRSVFISPQAKSSPDRRRASPVLISSPNPVRSGTPVDNLKLTASPHKITTEQQSDNPKEIDVLSKDKAANIPDDSSVQSVPKTNEVTLDELVRLQPDGTAPTTNDQWKDDVITDNADVLFDPINPLPSPSKVRPKLRPVPRLAPYRRNSVQGSASESEDESRRALFSSAPPPPPAHPPPPSPAPRQRHDSHTSHSTQYSVPNREANRIRNDSVCSTVSQVATQPPVTTSPLKEKHTSKSRRQEMSRRAWRRKEVKRDALTMYDLIFYNPTTNPIVPNQDEVSAKEANAKEEAERVTQPAESEEEPEASPADATPVPQIKLGPNGEIVLDEQSLVIKQSDANRKVSSVVREGGWQGSNYGRYTRSARTAEWSAAETVRFYRALQAIGTDFTLMAPLFPSRNRKDIYLKFKKEERLNGAQVDKALRSATSFDLARIQDEFKREREEAAKQAELLKQRLLDGKKAERDRMRALRDRRMRNSRAGKALETTMVPGVSKQTLTGDEFVKRALESRSQAKISGNNYRRTENMAKKPRNKRNVRPSSSFATLTLTSNTTPQSNASNFQDMATISRIEPVPAERVSLNEVSGVPTNIETGSLVVLRVNDPSSPSKTMLQTYIAHGAGKLTPVALPPNFLNSVVGYMKKGTSKSSSNASSPQLTSPSSVASQNSRPDTPGVTVNPSSNKRQRHSSYNITSL